MFSLIEAFIDNCGVWESQPWPLTGAGLTHLKIPWVERFWHCTCGE
jgi:hypothetical protein